MKRNVGIVDRALRATAGAASLACAALAPLSLPLRLAVFGAMGSYLLFSALAGTCLGYALMGRSTCPSAPKPR